MYMCLLTANKQNKKTNTTISSLYIYAGDRALFSFDCIILGLGKNSKIYINYKYYDP